MNTHVPYVVSGNTLTAYFNGLPRAVDRSHPNFETIVEKLKFFDTDGLEDLFDLPKALAARIQIGDIELHEDGITWKGEPLHNYMVSRILEHVEEDYPVEPLLKALELLMKNPSYRVREQLYRFLEASHIAFMPDGRFLAFKKVRDDFKDVHSGTFDNSPGRIVEMERRDVDDDPERTCSAGLHVCSWSYLPAYMGDRGKVVVVAVSPEDVVSVPTDYNNAKMRTCRYEVLREIPQDEAEFAFAGRYVVDDWYEEEDEEFPDYEDAAPDIAAWAGSLIPHAVSVSDGGRTALH